MTSNLARQSSRLTWKGTRRAYCGAPRESLPRIGRLSSWPPTALARERSASKSSNPPATRLNGLRETNLSLGRAGGATSGAPQRREFRLGGCRERPRLAPSLRGTYNAQFQRNQPALACP